MPAEDHLIRQVQTQEQRLVSLEQSDLQNKILAAARKERDKHLDERFDRLEAAVNELKGYLTRVVWIIMAGIITAFVSFVISGGLINATIP